MDSEEIHHHLGQNQRLSPPSVDDFKILKRERDDLRTELDTLKNEKSELMEANIELETSLVKAHSEKSSLNAQIDKYKARSRTLTHIIRELLDQTDD